MAEIGVSPRGKEKEKEKVGIVVAGGSGIGAACVRELAASGWRVVALSPSGRARLLAESLGGAGIDGSNTNVADLRATVNLAIEKFGRIDAVINNSGALGRGVPVLRLPMSNSYRSSIRLSAITSPSGVLA